MADQLLDLGAEVGTGAKTRTPFRRLPPDQRRDEILDAALELFGSRGEHEVSVEDVAAAAGTSRNSVYRCFGSKQELFVAAMAQLRSKLIDAQADPAPGTPSEVLTARLKRFLDVVEKYGAGYTALVRMDAPGAPEDMAKLIGELRERTYTRVYEGLGVTTPSPAVATTVHAWVAAMEWMVQEWLRERHMPRSEVESLLAVLLGVMLLGAASRDGTAGEVLVRLLDAESSDGPFAVHLARASDLMSMKVFSRLTGMMHGGAAQGAELSDHLKQH